MFLLLQSPNRTVALFVLDRSRASTKYSTLYSSILRPRRSWIQTTNKYLPLQAREFLISAQNLQLRRACANILLINLKRTKDSFVVNELRHEIVGVLRKTLSLHPSDTNALRALVLMTLVCARTKLNHSRKLT